MAPRGVAWVLAVVLGAALVAVDAPSLHQHRDTGPAWYDEECPSVRLAVAGSEPGVVPVVDTGHAIPPMDVVVPVTPAELLRRSLRPPGPRGPPIPA
jgi:hypothetical protein